LYFDIDKDGAYTWSFLSIIGFGQTIPHCYYWKGDGSSNGNLDTLYRSQFAQSFFEIFGFYFYNVTNTFSTANTAGRRREMMNHVVGTNFTIANQGTSSSLVTLNMTLRGRPDLAEGPGNRNFNFRTMARPRN
jgi:hypothetical protein